VLYRLYAWRVFGARPRLGECPLRLARRQILGDCPPNGRSVRDWSGRLRTGDPSARTRICPCSRQNQGWLLPIVALGITDPVSRAQNGKLQRGVRVSVNKRGVHGRHGARQ